MEMRTAERYVDSFFDNDEDLNRVKEALRERGIRDISVAPGFGKLLTILVRSSGATRILEFGALAGYSGICLARGLSPGGKLLSLEVNGEFAEMARQNLLLAGLADRVEYRVGEALESLEKLEDEGIRFDFFFIDADKENYPLYLDWALKLANPGALIVGDNALSRGRVADPQKDSPSVQALREFNRRMLSDPRLDGTLLPAYDGLCVARVIT